MSTSTAFIASPSSISEKHSIVSSSLHAKGKFSRAHTSTVDRDEEDTMPSLAAHYAESVRRKTNQQLYHLPAPSSVNSIHRSHNLHERKLVTHGSMSGSNGSPVSWKDMT